MRSRAVISTGFTSPKTGFVSYGAWWYWCPAGEATRSV